MNRMVVANLVHRPIRSLISVVAVAVEVVLILVVVGLMVGMLNDARARNRGIGADVIVQPPGSSVIGQISGAPVSIKIADIIRKLPHVAAVAPVVASVATARTSHTVFAHTEAPVDAPETPNVCACAATHVWSVALLTLSVVCGIRAAFTHAGVGLSAAVTSFVPLPSTS